MGFVGLVKTGSGSTIAYNPVGSTLYGICNVAANNQTKTVSVGVDRLITGLTVHVLFINENMAANPELDVDGLGPHPIYAFNTDGPETGAAKSWAAGSMVSFTFDGSAWRMNDAGANAAMINLLEGEITTETAARASAVSGLAAQIAAPYDSTETYTVGELCIYNDSLYRCTTEITTAEEWTAGHWTATNVRSEAGITIKLTNVTAGKDGTATATAEGTGVTQVTVDVATFETTVSETGTYVFTYDGAAWEYNSAPASLAAYGIDIGEQTPASGDKITVVYTVGDKPFMPNGTYPEYPFRAAIPMPGVTADMIPEVIFAMADAITGQFAPVAETGANLVYIYASSKPADEITIPVIICRG